MLSFMMTHHKKIQMDNLMRPIFGLIVPISLSIFLSACSSISDVNDDANCIDQDDSSNALLIYDPPPNLVGYVNIYERYDALETLYYIPSFVFVDGSMLVDMESHANDIVRIDAHLPLSDTSRREYDKWLSIQRGKHYTDCRGQSQTCITQSELNEFHKKNNSHIDDHDRTKFNLAVDDKIYFAFDKATLDRIAVLDIAAVKKYLDRYPNRVLQIRGRTDASGSNKYNEQLSKQRTLAVADELIRLGVPRSRVKLSWSGESGSGYGPSFRISELSYD